jgi:hypothetical protein
MKNDTHEYRRYRNRVTKLSEKTYNENVEIINPNNHKRTVNGIDGGYQLDHIVSVRKCFNDGISPENASESKNLQMLPWKQNLMKR